MDGEELVVVVGKDEVQVDGELYVFASSSSANNGRWIYQHVGGEGEGYL